MVWEKYEHDSICYILLLMEMFYMFSQMNCFALSFVTYYNYQYVLRNQCTFTVA